MNFSTSMTNGHWPFEHVGLSTDYKFNANPIRKRSKLLLELVRTFWIIHNWWNNKEKQIKHT